MAVSTNHPIKQSAKENWAGGCEVRKNEELFQYFIRISKFRIMW